ncbi:hypothetical protein Tco_0550156 [Tanacetum coccineum]
MVVRCACGLEAVIRTSWTNQNPGSSFLWLSYTYKWYDPPMCQRSVQIIPGLLRSRNELEEILAMVEEKRRKEVAFLLDVLSRLDKPQLKETDTHKGQKKAKNKQNRARDGKDKVKS